VGQCTASTQSSACRNKRQVQGCVA
jgi:hypothetical protein